MKKSYDFKVSVTDSTGLTSEANTSTQVVAPLPPEGVYISGVDSIDLNPHDPNDEYHFYVKENEHGELSLIQGAEIELETYHPGLSLYGNVISIQTEGDISSFPESIILKTSINGISYTKEVNLRKTVSRLVGAVPAGELSTYTINNPNSSFNGAIIKFSSGQFTNEPVELYETDLSVEKISLSLSRKQNAQPLEYVLESVPNNMIQAVDMSEAIHKSVVEHINEFRAMLLPSSYFACSYSPNTYYKNPVLSNDFVKRESGNDTYFYNFDPVLLSEKNIANENLTIELINRESSLFSGLQFVFFNQNSLAKYKEASALVYPDYRNVIWINLDKDFSYNTLLGVLLHEKAHVKQFNSLRCDVNKFSDQLRDLILESNAEYEVALNNDIMDFSVEDYLKDTTYNTETPYRNMITEVFFQNWLGDNEANAYMAGNIWDHLEFDTIVSKLKQMTLKTLPGNPYRGLKELIGNEAYANFMSDLLLYTYYPSNSKSFYSNIVANIFHATFSDRLPLSHFYSGQGVVQKIDLLRPWQSTLNVLDYNLITKDMDEYTRNNLRFKFLVYPSEDESLVEGFENIHVSLSNKGDLSPSVVKKVWLGDGNEPSSYEFDIDFDEFYDEDQTGQIQVILTNTGNEKMVPVYTTVIPEIRKQICYFGPSSLRVTFLHKSEGVLNDYSNNIVNAVVPTGECRDFHLIYNQGYFYELLVQTDPDAGGWLGNWNQDQYDETGNGFVYTYRPVDADPMNVRAKVKEYGDSGYYYVDLTLENVSPNTMFIY